MTARRYGAPTAHVVVVTAGRRPFDAAHRGGGTDFVADLPFQPFTPRIHGNAC